MKKSELQQLIREEISNMNLKESKKNVDYGGDTYVVDLIKNSSYEGPTWSLLLKDKKNGVTYALPGVFSYREGWTQGTNRSQRMYFLQTRGYGGVSQGNGRSSMETPSFIDDQLEHIISHWKGDGYSEDDKKWYQNNVQEFPKGTPKSEIKNALS
jgi:hypothetical protein